MVAVVLPLRSKGSLRRFAGGLVAAVAAAVAVLVLVEGKPGAPFAKVVAPKLLAPNIEAGGCGAVGFVAEQKNVGRSGRGGADDDF